MKPLEIWEVDKFDIIMGNPPYQNSNATGDNKLYLEFTKYVIRYTKKNGFILFITPRNILDYLTNVDKNRHYVDKFYQINYICTYLDKRYFQKVGSTFTYFLLQNTKYKYNTMIEYKDENNSVSITHILLHKGFKIPLVTNQIDFNILSKITSTDNNFILKDFTFNGKTQRIRKRHILNGNVKVDSDNTYKYKIIDTINKTNPFPGKYYFYSNIDDDFGQKRLVLSKKGYLMPFIDYSSEFTYSDNFKYIIDDNLEDILLILESIIIDYLLFQYSKNGFDAINIVKMIMKKSSTIKFVDINDVYKYYNINDNELQYMLKLLSKKN